MQKKSKKWQVTWANLSLVSPIAFCKLLWERDTMDTARMDNTLLLPSGNFWSAIGDYWHGTVRICRNERIYARSPHSQWVVSNSGHRMEWGSGRAGGKPYDLPGLCFYPLVNNWPLLNTKADSGSEAPVIPGCVYGLNTGKPLKSGLQFSFTWSPNSRDNSFHLAWNALFPLFSTISQNPRFPDRDMSKRSSNGFPHNTMNPGRSIKTGPPLNS